MLLVIVVGALDLPKRRHPVGRKDLFEYTIQTLVDLRAVSDQSTYISIMRVALTFDQTPPYASGSAPEFEVTSYQSLV